MSPDAAAGTGPAGTKHVGYLSMDSARRGVRVSGAVRTHAAATMPLPFPSPTKPSLTQTRTKQTGSDGISSMPIPEEPHISFPRDSSSMDPNGIPDATSNGSKKGSQECMSPLVSNPNIKAHFSLSTRSSIHLLTSFSFFLLCHRERSWCRPMTLSARCPPSTPQSPRFYWMGLSTSCEHG